MAAKRIIRAVTRMTGAIALIVTGCTAAGENAARTQWNDVRDERYVTPPPQVSSNLATDLAESASLDALIALAEQQNAGLRAAFDRWGAEVQTISRDKALTDPVFSYGYFIEPVETRVGPQRQRFRLNQKIPLSGELGLKGEMAAHAASVTAADYDAKRLELRFNITQLWNDYYYLSRAIEVTEENVGLLADLESVALSQYSAGRAPHATVVRAQVELGRLEDRLRTLKDQRGPILSALNAQLNRPFQSPIAWPDSVDSRPLALGADELRSRLLQMNPRLNALTYEANRQTTGAKLAGRSAIPDLTIGAEYIQTDKLDRIPNSGQDAIIATAMINIPLWYGQYSAEKAQANARRSAIVNEQTQLRNELLAQFERALFEFRDAERRVDLYLHSLLPRGRQSLEVTEDAFVAGEADFLEWVDAQRTLLEFELAHERAVADRATRRAHIEQLVGAHVGSDGREDGHE